MFDKFQLRLWIVDLVDCRIVVLIGLGGLVGNRETVALLILLKLLVGRRGGGFEHRRLRDGQRRTCRLLDIGSCAAGLLKTCLKSNSGRMVLVMGNKFEIVPEST